MIDSHAHLSRRFAQNFENDIVLAEKSGLKRIILAASCLEDTRDNLKLAEDYPQILAAAAGIHPQQTDPENSDSIDKQLEQLEKIIQDSTDKIVAIGECGLDFSPAPPEEKDRTEADQKKLFIGQIGLAERYKKPLIIHAREAVDATIEILKDNPGLRGVFHCYAGGKKRINKIIGLGSDWYFGFDGNLTYEAGLTEVVKAIPPERIVLETDSPFLAPLPHRGETNSPAYVEFVYKKLAEIWGKSFVETEKAVDENAKRLFGVFLG